MHSTTFAELGLANPILRALEEEGYSEPTPVQAQAIPHLVKGEDLLASAQTGTGKTAAFALPIIQLHKSRKPEKGFRHIHSLILTPTRELAQQISDSFKAYGRHLHVRHTVIYGGVNQNPQVKSLRRGVDVVIATPGRLLDLIGQGYVDLRSVQTFVLDEADRMLDMGFINDIKKIIGRLPQERQNVMFSATMPGPIAQLSRSILKNPVRVEITPEYKTAETVQQLLFHVDKRKKSELLQYLIDKHNMFQVLVFSRTKHGADKLVKVLKRENLSADAIHGNKSQAARQRALNRFKQGKTRVLVATDIAARGIDIDDLEYVINYDLPNEAETYVHRIGRTGRAGAEGHAFSFCASDQRKFLRDIQKLIEQKLPVEDDHPYHSMAKEEVPLKKRGRAGGGKPRSFRGNGRPGSDRPKRHAKGSGRPGGRTKRGPEFAEKDEPRSPEGSRSSKPKSGNREEWAKDFKEKPFRPKKKKHRKGPGSNRPEGSKGPYKKKSGAPKRKKKSTQEGGGRNRYKAMAKSPGSGKGRSKRS